MVREFALPDGYKPVSELTDNDPRAIKGCMVIMYDKRSSYSVYGIASRPHLDNPREVADATCDGWRLWYVTGAYGADERRADRYLARNFTVTHFKELEPLYVDVAEGGNDGVD